MGRKPKNKKIQQILPQEQIEQEQSGELNYQLLSKKILKKTVIHRIATKDNKNYSNKRNKYFNVVENGSIYEIVNQKRFQCPICLQLLVKPTLIKCGHMYCERCLQSFSAKNGVCGICRAKQIQSTFIPSSFAETMINQLIVPRSSEYFKYLCRTTDSSQWIKRRNLNHLRTGIIVDFQDSQKKWKRGLIVNIFSAKNRQPTAKILYYLDGQKCHQNVEINSKRLAPCNFFTGTKYLQQYQPTLPQYSIYEKDLQRLEYKIPKSEEDIFNFGQEIQEEGLENNQIQQFKTQEAQQNTLDQALALFNWQMNDEQPLI